MFKSLKSKITVPVISLLALLVVLLVIYASTSTANLIERTENDRLDAAIAAVRAYLRSYERQTFLAAAAMGSSAELIRLVHEGDEDAVWQYAYNQKNFFGVHEIIIGGVQIIDGNPAAVTLARSHQRDNNGDNISGVPSVGAALRGERITLYTPTPTAYMVMTSTSPIMDDGVVIGTVVVNYVVGRNEFLDQLGETFGIDATVFNRQGYSVSSTLILPGTVDSRATGTRARPDIIDTVLEGGETLYLELSVFDTLPYLAFYFPLPGVDGNPNAMFFVGIPQMVAQQTAFVQVRNLVIIGAAGLIVAGLIMLWLIIRSLKPLDALKNSIAAVAAGNININLPPTGNDEIGAIAGNVGGLVSVIHGMVNDVSAFTHEFNNNGDIEYRINAIKYQGSFGEMMMSLNNFADGTVDDVMSILGVLSNVNKGDFDSHLKVLPGKKIVLNETIDQLLINLHNVNDEIKAMIDATANKGDLDFRIDSGKYQGDWRKLMDDLNSIAVAVDIPLKVIEIAALEMQVGNFDIEVIDAKLTAIGINADTDSYAGAFRKIIAALEVAIVDSNAYIIEIDNTLAAMASGDLTHIIERDYVGSFNTIRLSVNDINTTLNRTMTEISAAADQVLSGARQISTSANDLANGAQSQSSSVEELNAAIDLIMQQTEQNAASAVVANELSGKSTVEAQEGNASMMQMVDAMKQIKESSNSISKIVKTIQDIAFQTNLLALNASVEAARAGEHGKGFSVVADEVRTLSGRSSEAASDTTRLIQDSIVRVDAGSNIAETTAKSLDAIVAGASEVLAIISNIAASSKEQADAIANVSDGIEQISKVVQSNSAVSEETAAASEELNSQAELLQQLVSYFKL